MAGLIGTKIGMTQVFAEDGSTIPVTVVGTGRCTVVQIRSVEKDGYDGLQLGVGERKEGRLSKALRSHMNKAGRANFARLFEVGVDDISQYTVGQEISVADVFEVGDIVDVTGTTKGRGFSGVMRRHNYGGHRATHGTHESFRGPGAIGACAYPGRVWKGKGMPGQMGAVRATIQSLTIVEIRDADNAMLISGAVPGGRGGEILVRSAVKGS